MPYMHCPSCHLSTFSAARHSSSDECPRCGAELRSKPGRLFARDAATASRKATLTERVAELQRRTAQS